MENRQHGDGPAEIVGHQHEAAGRNDAHERWPRAAGGHGVEQLEFPVCSIDREYTDRAFLVFPHPIRFIGGIKAGTRGIQSKTARARAHLVDSSRRHGPGLAIHQKDVNPATIAGREINLSRQHIAQRRAEGSDVGEKWLVGLSRLRL